MDFLSEEIRKNGFIYRLEKRGQKAMIYKQICPDESNYIAYEVFKIKVDKPKIVFGIQLNEREIFPGNEDFGKWAWATNSLERAEYKFQRIESGIEEVEEEINTPNE
jgi:hypothetical protein